jgi:hypothetical protein
MATQRLTLTPTLSRKRERGREAAFIGGGAIAAVADRGDASLLPLAGEGGAKRRMRVSRDADHSCARRGL